ncbi:MAG: ribonuclease H-like domain-containing protein [Clostridiales bacterium]|nr:ribonuclease H-like domain-containing protein [Clostridiales bacterium]
MNHEASALHEEDIRLIEGTAMNETLMSIAPGYSLTDYLFFDIETTGLSAETSFIFLIGCIGYKDDTWMLHQFFIRTVQEEKALLTVFFELAQNYQVLVHFNGNTFDLPFIRKRAAANGLEPVTDALVSADLYRYFTPLRKILSLPHMNQSFLEHYVGWNRNDQMSGREVVSLFWKYSVSRSMEEKQLLLLHNHDDLLGMLRVPSMEAYYLLFSGRILPDISAEETETGDALLLKFSMVLSLPVPVELPILTDENHAAGSVILSAGNHQGQISVPLYCGTLRYFFPDYENYYFLPLENQAIHKSVAAFVSKEYRTAARPENCYIEKKGRFLPLPSTVPNNGYKDSVLTKSPFSPMLRESYDSKHSYFEYTGLSCQKEQNMDHESLQAYTRILLSSCSCIFRLPSFSES